MINLLDDTERFMRMARQLDAVGFPKDYANELRTLRRKLLAEEYVETGVAEGENNLVEITDGLLDVIVIAWGTLLSYLGPDAAKAAAMEVQRSNLEKVIGEGLPLFREDGKVIKPAGWRGPDIAGVLEEFGITK